MSVNRLLESWTNGNRKDVVDELLDGPPHAIVKFTRRLSREDSTILIRMMRQRRVDEALIMYSKLPITATPEEFIVGGGNWGFTEAEYAEAIRLAHIIVTER